MRILLARTFGRLNLLDGIWGWQIAVLEAFPVLSEHTLAPARTWSRFRHRVDLLPPRQTGVVRVFEVDGSFIPEQSGPERQSAYLIANASSVSMVDILPRTLVMGLPVSAPAGSESCELQFGFRCQAVDPATVARHHVNNLSSELDSYFSQSPRLQDLIAVSALDAFNDLHQLIKRQLIAQFSVRPVRVPGMRIAHEFMFVKVQ